MAQLTSSEQLLLHVLTRLVRYVSKRQATRLLGFSEPSQTERVFVSLDKKGLVRFGRVPAVPPAECPILMHEYGPHDEPLVGDDKDRFFSRLHNKIKTRVGKEGPGSDNSGKKRARKTRAQSGNKPPEFPVVHATERAVNLFGGTNPNLSKPFQIEHDLKCAELVVRDRNKIEKELLVAEIAILAHNASALARFNSTPPANNAIPVKHSQLPNTIDEDGNSLTALYSPLLDQEPTSLPPDAARSSKARAVGPPEPFSLLSMFDSRWWGEDMLVRHKLSVGAYTPDLAVVINGRIVHAVEVATINYGKARLVEIENCCVANDVTYQIYA